MLAALLAACTASGQDQALNASTCNGNVVLMGYWPPTNEMLRPWSPHPQQNPDGWKGANWHGYGFDVVAFFPEFPPDGDPTNNAIGDAGSVGSGDLTVDYQDTSHDFWRIAEHYLPVALITTSRGGDIGWELELIEGGHGGGADPSQDWISDRADVAHPTRATVDARSWTAIETYRAGKTLASTLPLEQILENTTGLNLTDVAIDTATSGNYLSGFLGLHGVYYQSINPNVIYAGHIHVGRSVSVDIAHALMQQTLDVVLANLTVRRHCDAAGP